MTGSASAGIRCSETDEKATDDNGDESTCREERAPTQDLARCDAGKTTKAQTDERFTGL